CLRHRLRHLLLLKPRYDRDLPACFQRFVAVDAPRRRQKVLPTTWRQPPALRSETTRSSARRLRISNGKKRGGMRVRPSALSRLWNQFKSHCGASHGRKRGVEFHRFSRIFSIPDRLLVVAAIRRSDLYL